MTTKAHKRKNRAKKPARPRPKSSKDADFQRDQGIKRQKRPADSSSAKMNTRGASRPTNNDDDDSLVFQDVMAKYSVEESSLAFFELANALSVAYRLPNPTTNESRRISIRQNSQAQTHTGGVVWETSYLLLEYLQFVVKQQHQKSSSPAAVGKRVVEVGAGCGLLGLAISFLPTVQEVLLTETEEVNNTILLPNVQRNQSIVSSSSSCQVSACALDWLYHERDFQAYARERKETVNNKFDTIVGTDVVFSPSLVQPLLATLQFLSHGSTVTYLCLQSDRCPTSYQMLKEEASDYGFEIQEIDSRQLRQPPTKGSGKEDADGAAPSFVSWGLALECHLLCLRRTQR